MFRKNQERREVPRLRRPTASQERSGKRKSACSARNDNFAWGLKLKDSFGGA